MRSCFFFHNPKAGGTALRASLEAQFAPEEIAPVVDLVPEVYGRGSEGPPPGYRLYAGHYGYDVCRQVAHGHALISNFRHPAARVVSLYNYFRRQVPDTPKVWADPVYFAVRTAKTVSFDEFVASDDPRILTYTADHHFRQLANSGWSLETARSMGEVRDLVHRLDWFYLCEHPQLAARWGRAVLRAPGLSVGRVNVTETRGSPSAAILEVSEPAFRRVLALNERDLEIYDHAVLRFFAEVDGRARTWSTPRRPARDGRRNPVPRWSPGRARTVAAAALAVAGLGLAAGPGLGGRGAGPTALAAADPAVATLRAHLADPAQRLTRRDLVTFVRLAGDPRATGIRAADVADRPFRLEVPLACGERAPPRPSSSARWWYDKASGQIRFRVSPSAWGGGQAGGLIWISQPKFNAATCPAGLAPRLDGQPLVAGRVGVVAANLEAAPGGAKPYVAAAPARPSDLARIVPSLRLRLEGRLAPETLAPTCREGVTDPTADCAIGVRLERVSVVLDPAAPPVALWRAHR